jgi:CHAT domain-containing protein
MVIDALPAGVGASVEPASGDRLNELLSQPPPPNLVHFICHGKTDKDGQYLSLEGKTRLTTSMIPGLDGVLSGLRRGRPLIFLNACEVGRQEIDLASPDGFAQVFMQEGASAVIAPLWSVKDRIAHEIAKTFYEQLRTGRPLAEILRDLRAKSYEDPSEDTYAAYCFYGDPLAVGEVQ